VQGVLARMVLDPHSANQKNFWGTSDLFEESLDLRSAQKRGKKFLGNFDLFEESLDLRSAQKREKKFLGNFRPLRGA
jgi:hypothetical protein